MAKYNSFLSKAAAYHIDHCFSWKYIVDVRAGHLSRMIGPTALCSKTSQQVITWHVCYTPLTILVYQMDREAS